MPRRRSCSTRVPAPGPMSSAAAWVCPAAILPELIDAGSALGTLRPSVADELGLTRPINVIVPATHDTASAVAAVPAVRFRASSAQSPHLVLFELGHLVAAGRRGFAARDQRGNDEV